MKLSLVIVTPEAELRVIDYLKNEWFSFTVQPTVIVNVILWD